MGKNISKTFVVENIASWESCICSAWDILLIPDSNCYSGLWRRIASLFHTLIASCQMGWYVTTSPASCSSPTASLFYCRELCKAKWRIGWFEAWNLWHCHALLDLWQSKRGETGALNSSTWAYWFDWSSCLKCVSPTDRGFKGKRNLVPPHFSILLEKMCTFLKFHQNNHMLNIFGKSIVLI